MGYVFLFCFLTLLFLLAFWYLRSPSVDICFGRGAVPLRLPLKAKAASLGEDGLPLCENKMSFPGNKM
ncbi:hypothetical protein GH733_000293 [Mirounga leonina]|nr:hypothetical protein GH733_000293 [Mirounga leonina]